jgi:hypothetical protein
MVSLDGWAALAFCCRKAVYCISCGIKVTHLIRVSSMDLRIVITTMAQLECPAFYVPVSVRETGAMKGPENLYQVEG